MPRSVQDLLYEWEANGILKKRTDQLGTSGTGDDRVETFSYDALDRVEAATAVLPGVTNRIKNYAYAANGDLTTKTSNLSGDLDATGYAYASGRLTSATLAGVATTFVHDANGSLTRYDRASGDDTFIDYDAGNRAVRITLGTSASTATPTARDEFFYDPDGQRFLRKATWEDGGQKTAWTLYLAGGVFEEVHPQWDATVSYSQSVQVSDAVRHRRLQTPSGSTTAVDYVYRDHLGSVAVVTDATGAVVQSLAFDPFGSRRAADWSSDITASEFSALLGDETVYGSRGFTDHEHLNRTGIVHMNGRIYDPALGRFLQVDPIVSDWTYSQDHNRYAYVWNSPLSLVDPSGLMEGGESNVTVDVRVAPRRDLGERILPKEEPIVADIPGEAHYVPPHVREARRAARFGQDPYADVAADGAEIDASGDQESSIFDSEGNFRVPAIYDPIFGAPVPIRPGHDAEFAKYNFGQAVTGLEAGLTVWGAASVGKLSKLSSLRVRVHLDSKPHRFPDSWGPLAGNRAHLQVTIYLKGVKNSHIDLRIPVGPRKPWGDHQP